MRKILRLLVSLLLVVLFLVTCLVSLTLGYSGLLLHTYTVFTQREAVAKVVISEQREDEFGKYAIVKLQQIKPKATVLTRGIFGDADTSVIIEPVQEFKVYGDFVYIGGPILKFHDHLIWINFKNAYKLARLYGRYETDITEENKRTNEIRSNFDLNGGLAEWQEVFRVYQGEGFLSDFLRSIFDTTFLSMAGQKVANREITYTILITNNGFMWKIE